MYSAIKTFMLNLFLPLPLCLCLLFIGLIFLWLTKKQQFGKVLVTAGFSILLLSSLPIIPNELLGQLEQQYPSITTKNQEDNFKDIKYIVVLAGGHVLDPRIPITSQFLYTGIVRLVEGIRLHKKTGEAKLILSGGPGIDPITDAELMSRLALELGIHEKDIILESQSMNTLDEARFISPIVGKDRFLLITSASHMVRSVALFKKMGMNPVPAPTDHLVKLLEKQTPIFPSTANILKSDTLIYEYLGLIKERINGNI